MCLKLNTSFGHTSTRSLLVFCFYGILKMPILLLDFEINLMTAMLHSKIFAFVIARSVCIYCLLSLFLK